MTKVVIESKKWFKEAKELVRNFDFNLVTVLDNRIHEAVTNCQFCNQAINYVAVIDGLPKNATSGVPVRQQIGCDCLERVLGNTWKHYGSAMTQYKKLVDAAKVESRKAKYAEVYAKEIQWLILCPSFLMNGFLRDMHKILTTGSKQMSKNMLSYLHSYMNNPKYNNQKAVESYSKTGEQKEKLRKLLEAVEKKDGKNIHEKWSAYHFVNSVLNNVDRQNGMTPKQMEAINKVHVRYNKVVTPVVVKSNSTLPF